MLGGEYKQ